MAAAMTRSAIRLAKESLATARAALPRYSSRFSRHDYTLPALLATLVVKCFLKMDYRTCSQTIADWPERRRALGFRGKVPHPSTLNRAPARLLSKPLFRRVLAVILRRARRYKLLNRDATATVDGTGFESHHVSAHYRVRKGERAGEAKPRRPKVTIVGHAQTHLWVAAITGRGPCNDAPAFRPAMKQAARLVRFRRVLADKGFDAEPNHRLCRQALRIRSTAIPLIKRKHAKGKPKGRYRRRMAERFPRRQYPQRWQAESGFSRHKRRLGSALSAKRYLNQNRELLLRVLTHDLMILHARAA